MGRRGVFGRVRTVLVFSMLLIACVAAPVLARSTGSGAAGSPKIGISDARALGTSQASGSRGSELTQPSESVEAEPAPGAEEPGEAGPVAEAPFEPQREPVLETPQAIAERQESQLAYSEITPAEEASLLKESFAPQLQEISADPSRLLGAAKLDQIFSPTEALASVEGEPALIDSSVPLRASNSEGKLSKVDLGLEETQQGYSPANPLVDVQLPRTAAGQIGVGDEGLSLSLQGASPKAEASQTDGGGVFVPEAGEDTSLLLAPISAGLELSAMLTSRLSPEQLAFSVSLPEGDQLRAASDGGAEVIDPQGEVTYRLFAPRAIDAQGTVLPVALAVEGNTLLISLKHREMDVAYPILIDPEFIAEGWSNIIGSGKWTWEWSGVPNSETYIGSFSCVVAKQEGCNWGTGLYVRSRSNTTYPEHSYGRWKLNAPNTTSYFRYASMGPAHFNARGCTANEPHGYFGIWLGGASWSMLGPAYPSGWTTELIAPTWGPPLSTAGHTAFVGLEAEHASNITCGRDYALTGATFYMSDPENPTVSGLSGIPSGWIKGGTPFTVTEPVSDNGLGVKSAKLNSDGGESPQSLSCSGSLSNPCPASHNFEFSVNAGTFPEGQRTISASAKDVLEKSSNTQEAALKIDRTKPGVILKGQLAEATEEEGGLAAEEEDETPFDPLHLAVYNLTIEATDVGTSGDANAKKRSGVKRIEAFLDGSKTPLKTWTQPGEPSTCDSCALTATYTLKLNELGADTHHTLRVLATDFAGNDPREREIGFEYVPATGEKDEYVMQHFPLFDTEAEPEEGVEATGPELAVNLMNGNLVFHQQDVEVPGPAADLEVERFYNSLLPEDQNTEWGDGWTLAQTPELELEEPKSGPPAEGTLVEESGGVESQVSLPTKAGEEEFDPALQAMITKESGGGYALTDETGESAGTVQFTESGQASELETGEFSGVQYDYSSGELSEIAVEDAASAAADPEEAALREELEEITPKFVSAFGTSGNGNGQFNVLNDVAIDPTDGSLWGSDDDNDRIEHFSASGEYLGKFASCYDPSAVQVEAAGNVYVACASGSSSVKKYSDTGTLLATIAGYGKANGQVNFPLGLALDAEENLWVADTENNRAEEFSPSGSFKKAISLGEFSRPKGIAVGSNGTVWVTETWANRVSGYDQEGKLLHRFGSSGSGQGQFAHPSDVAVDAHGYVWVADSKNDRVQIFNEAGEYITSFGEKGSGPGQLNDDWWIRLALDAKGNVWLSDEGNHRIERWRAPGITMTEPGVPMQDDPSLAVEVSEGLVEAVEGEQAGPVEYEHSGEQLTAVSCEEGETSYEYDEAGHMTKVELPNGSWAEIEYEATYGRVKAVKVSIEGGTAKTTHFEYTDSPSRSTRVVPEGPATVYDMAADGSFVRWQNAAKAPEIEELAGTLVDPEHRETANPIEPGAYLLEVKAYSEEGIAKIEVIANGNIQVDEKTCAEDFEKYEPECKNVADQWVTETGSWSPGILNLEVIVTDREGNEASERFWVNIPYTPPPDPEVEAPPTFSEVKTFREEFGLDLDLKGDEEAINERTWSLLRAWENPYTPAGEVARATSERWGVPLRQVDAAELEYREWFYHIDAERIDHWVQETKPSSFAGYYIDHAAGGVMHIGFTKDQIEQLDSLKASLSLVAGDRLQVYPAIPVASYLSVRAAWESVSSALESNSTLSELIVDVKFDEAGKTVRVGTPDVAQVEGILNQMVGTGGPISVEYEADEGSLLSGRYRNEGRMLAGDAIFSRHYTTGFVHDGSEEGGFKWSSQHLIEEGCDGKVEGLGIKADGSTADALAGSSTGRAS